MQLLGAWGSGFSPPEERGIPRETSVPFGANLFNSARVAGNFVACHEKSEADKAKLGADQDLFSNRLQGLADLLFLGKRSISLLGVNSCVAKCVRFRPETNNMVGPTDRELKSTYQRSCPVNPWLSKGARRDSNAPHRYHSLRVGQGAH